METFGGTTCNNSFIRGTNAALSSPFPTPLLMRLGTDAADMLTAVTPVDGSLGDDPLSMFLGTADMGGADKIDVSDGEHDATEDADLACVAV